jgi:hypothetical protein
MSASGFHGSPKTDPFLTPEHIRELFAEINAQLADFQDTLQQRWSARQATLHIQKNSYFCS